VAARSKAWVYGRSIAGIVGSNPAGGMVVSLCWVLCVVRYRSLRRADHSSTEVLPNVMRRCVCDLETSRMKRPWPALGRSATGKKQKVVMRQPYVFLILLSHCPLSCIRWDLAAIFFISELKPLDLMKHKKYKVSDLNWIFDVLGEKSGYATKDITIILTFNNFWITFCHYDFQCVTTNVPKQDGRQNKMELISDGHSGAIIG